MKLRQTYRLLFQLTWAFAIVWISLGSLINFHQHHLWRKQLIPQVVASLNKKDKSKFVVQFRQNQDSGNDNGIDLIAVSDVNTGSDSYYPQVTLVLPDQVNADLPATGLYRSHGLRAPPAL